jgi:hypothetical protein
MPRKPKPPLDNMTIEGLSELEDKQTVEVLRSKVTFTDDFTGEVKQVKPEIAERMLERAKVIEDYAIRRKALHIQSREAWEAVDAHRRELTEAIVLKRLTPQPPAKPFKRRF